MFVYFTGSNIVLVRVLFLRATGPSVCRSFCGSWKVRGAGHVFPRLHDTPGNVFYLSINISKYSS